MLAHVLHSIHILERLTSLRSGSLIRLAHLRSLATRWRVTWDEETKTNSQTLFILFALLNVSLWGFISGYSQVCVSHSRWQHRRKIFCCFHKDSAVNCAMKLISALRCNELSRDRLRQSEIFLNARFIISWVFTLHWVSQLVIMEYNINLWPETKHWRQGCKGVPCMADIGEVLKKHKEYNF